jgi:hypothetical protein
MSRFLSETVTDMRNGRETWRVFLALGAPAFTIALVIAALQIR